MRILPYVLSAIAAAAVVAPELATADDDVDGSFAALPGRSIGVGFVTHGSRIGGQPVSGSGAALELALGRGRWQYLGEAALANADMKPWSTPAAQMRIDGRMIHGGLGVRWLARQFRPADGGGVELFLLSALGLQRYYFADGGRLTRPAVALGTGLQLRKYKRPRFGVRLEVRVVFTPSDREDTLVACHGRCMAEAGSSTGFAFGIGLSW